MSSLPGQGRRVLRVFSTVALALVLILSGCVASGQVTVSTASGAYVFPVQPGTAAWASLKTRSEIVDACQVPDEELQRMSTKALVETVLSCPLIGDVMAYSNLQDGLNALARHCNSLRELLSRKDSGSILMTKYFAMDPGGYPANCSTLDKGKHCASLAMVEILLGNAAIQSSLSKNERDRLKSVAWSNYQSKRAHPDVYSSFSLNLTTAISGQNSKRAYVLRDYSSYVLTPRGTPILVYTIESEMSEPEIAYLNDYVEKYYPSAQRLSDASQRYNCHSYCWYMQAPNDRWMDAPNQMGYFTDGSFLYVEKPTPGMQMLRIMYASDDHSAVVESYNSDTDIVCTSKWGALPIMRHNPDYTPYDSSEFFYFSPDSNGIGVPYSNLFPIPTAPATDTLN